MRWSVVVLAGCTSKADDALIVDDTAADTDTDTDTDGDADTDTDTDADLLPCPFAGEWTIGPSTCDALPLTVSGTAHIEGTADRCLVRFEGSSPSGCAVVEQVELLPAPFDLWQAYTDGAPDSQDCLGFPGPARAIGDIGIVVTGPDLVWTHYGAAPGVALKIVDPCDSELQLVLQP